MREFNKHVATGIIISPSADEFLFSMYDQTHPKEKFRGRLNLFGGNYEEGDQSPWGLFSREVTEEFSYRNERLFASEEDINAIRHEILGRAIPYKDFYVSYDNVDSGSVLIYGVFLSRINQDVFELAKSNINSGKKIVCEGDARVVGLDDLVSKKFLLIPPAQKVMEEFIGTKISSLEGLNVGCIGKPRDSFTDYLSEFKVCERK